jgi:putative membrane protein
MTLRADQQQEQAGALSGPARTSEHLANERTYLAYLRTAVSLISFGVTINRFSLFLLQSGAATPPQGRSVLRDAENVGFGMVILGTALMVWAATRYTRVRAAIGRGDFRPSLWEIWVLTAGVLIVGGYSAFWLVQR